MGIKRRRIELDFKNINLYKRQNAPKKSKSLDKDFVYYTGGPLPLDLDLAIFSQEAVWLVVSVM
jgi:hypothetical protein